jgi:hypothetical protein
MRLRCRSSAAPIPEVVPFLFIGTLFAAVLFFFDRSFFGLRVENDRQTVEKVELFVI